MRFAHRTFSRIGFITTLAAGLLGTALAPPATAQLPAASNSDRDTVDIDILPYAPRELKQKLSSAKKALDAEQYADAVDLLGELLSDSVGEDFFTRDGQLSTSLKSEALKLLGSMPAKGRESYELQFGAVARALLDDAVANGELAKLAEVSRRYFHTKAGYEATLLLGRYYLDQGRPIAGAMCLKRLAEAPAGAPEFEPELSLLLAACWLRADMPDKAEDALVKGKASSKGGKVTIGAREIAWFAEPAQAVAWFREAIGAGGAARIAQESQWTMFRGNAGRNGQAAGDVPLLNFRWRSPTAIDRNDEILIKKARKTFLDLGLAVIPSVNPLAVQDTVLMRTPDLLVGIDLQSGKCTWVYPAEISAPPPQSTATVRIQGAPNDPNAGRMRMLQQRLLEDSPYGQMSSDGKLVFFIDKLNYAFTNGYFPQMVIINNRRMQNREAPQPHNELVAIELKREGALLWSVGGELDDEPKLKGAFFLGPPLPLGGELYALAEIKGEIQLVVLDSRTGKLQWSQQIAQVSESFHPPIMQDAPRRLAGAVPSFADGIMVCPTSAGAVVAVDMTTRALLWGFKYAPPRDANQIQNGFWQQGVYMNQPENYGRRWTDATATVVDGKVLVTPVESDKLYCLDLLSGRKLWEKDRGELLYLGCVHDGKAVVVGKNSVVALKLSDGAEVWKAELQSTVSGRGVYSEKSYLVPTAAAQLVQLDLADGKVLKRTATKEPLGNLICYQDQIISQGADWLSCFYQAEPLRKEVQRRLEKDPRDAWALTRHAELQLYDGKKREALETLRQSLAIKPDDGAARGLLAETLLQALRDDFAANAPLVAEVEALIELPAQRAEFLRLVADGLAQAGQARQAFDAYLRIATAQNNSELDKGDALLETVERDWSVRRDRWIQARLARLVAEASETERPKVHAAIAAQFALAEKANTVAAWRQFINLFGAHELADAARLKLAERLLALDDLASAEPLLTKLAIDSDGKLLPQATTRLAQLLERAQRPAEAAVLYRQVGDKFASAECLPGQTGRQVVDSLPADSPARRALTSGARWPSGKARVTTSEAQTNSPERQLRFLGGNRAAPLAIRESRGPLGLGAIASVEQGRTLVLRDLRGADLMRVPLSRNDNTRPFYPGYTAITHGKANGHLLVLSLGVEVVAVNMLQRSNSNNDGILWRQDLVVGSPTNGMPMQTEIRPKPLRNPWLEQPRYVAADPFGRTLGALGPVTEEGVCFLRGRELVCVDPLSGEVVWTRDGLAPGSDLFGDENYLIVAQPNNTKATVYRLADGSRVRECEVPDEARRWTTVGRHVLTWSEDGRGLQLRLEDPLAEKEKRTVWSRDFVNGARGWLVENEEVGVLEPNGKFVLLNLRSGQPKVEAALEAENALSGIYVLRSPEQYLVVVNRPLINSEPDSRFMPAPGGTACPLINGKVYAFGRESGKKLWPVPAVINGYGLPLDQPPDVPVVAFLRNTEPTQARSRRKGQQTSILCLDKRDGRIVLQNEDIPGHTNIFEMIGNLEKKNISISLPAKSFTINFTDDPQPPEPPAQMGAASSLEAHHSTAGIVGSIFGAISRANGVPGGSSNQFSDEDWDLAPSEDPFGGAVPAAKK